MRPCPSALICTKGGTCQHEEDVEPPEDASIDEPDAPPIDACVPSTEICDDGIDQDCSGADSTCAANDQGDDPVDVTNGGTFTGNLLLAMDDYGEVGCGGTGGRDLFYDVTLDAPQVYYFDTFGSDFDTTIRVFPNKACDQLVPNSALLSCNNDACGGDTSQLAVQLPSGTSCIVIDEADDDDASGALTLHVTRGGRTGTALGGGMQTLTGDSCTSVSTSQPNIACNDPEPGAKDVAWYFTACPGVNRNLDASTCVDVTMVHFDTVLYVRKAGVQADLVCRDDSEQSCTARPDRPDHIDGTVLTNVNTTGPGLFWLILDAFGTSSCGGYRLDTNLD
jgi:hypothetical protein